MRNRLIFFLFLATGAIGASAQTASIGPSTINAMGGNTFIGTNEFEWSVGEMTLVGTFPSPYAYSVDTDTTLTQGVLQPITWPVKVNAVSAVTGMNVYPNPASTIVNLQYQSGGQGTLSYKLMDMMGQVMKTGNVDLQQGSNSAQVDVRSLACATYLLVVTIQPNGANSQVTTYKIDKLK